MAYQTIYPLKQVLNYSSTNKLSYQGFSEIFLKKDAFFSKQEMDGRSINQL
ncbi:hypothetical protein FD11_GL002062 [Ligilactobacillus pobuzihii E100301 = KCTC 13174]|uniref:Uncharacterized protein n=1 Tax=Ligilactobacillus pobuzihii TaxID=449659 RepID=A0A0R2L8H7_9LACO|nr:hypothetical protein FD11_GL002062 [Ligilactobacillus pobuzihii E100301 = KCTC 13174]KRN98136.1 hypothetical protein IV66_GL002074 [Ligilactobacillus pobuzihii]